MEPEIILLNLESWLKSEVRRLAQEETRFTRMQDWLSAGGKRAERVAIASVIDKLNQEKKGPVV